MPDDDNNLYATGLQLDFMDSPDPEMLEGVTGTQKARCIARNAWRFLMMGWRPVHSMFYSFFIFRAILIRHNPMLIDALAIEYQAGLAYVYTQLHKKQLSELEQAQAELYLSNVLTYLPYIEPTEGQFLQIPRYIKGEWQFCVYKIQRIELTNPDKSMRERDRVYAFGLNPLKENQGRPILVIPGTTYPKGQGFWTHLETDFDGFSFTGKKLYQKGKSRLQAWISQSAQKPDVLGVSLGGAIALQMAADIGNILHRVDALNPVALPKPLWGVHQYAWSGFSADEKPKVIIQRQENDPVSILCRGCLDKWMLLQCKTSPKYAGPNGFVDHAINMAGFCETRYEKIDPCEDEAKHFWYHFIVYQIVRRLLYFTVIAPLCFVILPCVRALASLTGAVVRLTTSVFKCAFAAAKEGVQKGLSGAFFALSFLFHTALGLGRLIRDTIGQAIQTVGRFCSKAEENGSTVVHSLSVAQATQAPNPAILNQV